MRVAAEVGQHRLRATERRFGVDDPFRLAERCQPSGERADPGQPGKVAEEDQVSGSMEVKQAFDKQATKEP